LQALLPLWLPWARTRFRLSPALEEQLLALSPRQMDRRLQPHKRRLPHRRYGRTKPGTLLKHHIPLKTDRWDVTTPGFTEIDLVAHAGERGDGEFLHSLNLTDIPTTGVETRAVLGRGQAGVRDALEEMRRALPFRLRGIDSDNGSEFINAHLYRYCRAHEIQFTRGRPYKKDDNAHIEQKNWTHVRKLFGYVRYDSPEALTAMNALYRQELRLFQNLFLPSVKLVRKVRVGPGCGGCTTARRRPWSACWPPRRGIRGRSPTCRLCGSDSIPSPSPRPLTRSWNVSTPWPTPALVLSRRHGPRPSRPSNGRACRRSRRSSGSPASWDRAAPPGPGGSNILDGATIHLRVTSLDGLTGRARGGSANAAPVGVRRVARGSGLTPGLSRHRVGGVRGAAGRKSHGRERPATPG